MFINSINFFRGIAILIIVLGHSYWVAGFDGNASDLNKTFMAIATGGTSLFVFVSGFMFHHVFYQRKFNYKKFLKNKWKNVGLPFLIMSSYAIYKAVYLKESYLKLADIGYNVSNKLEAILFYYGTGFHMIAYWYIPFAGFLFVASPIYLKFIKLENRKQIAIIVVGYLISGIIHRPEYNINHIQSLIYFSPAYMLGIWSSINKELIYEKLKNKEIYILLIIIGLGYLQGVVLDHPDGYHKAMFEFKGIDVTIYQKIFIIYFFMVFLHRFEGRRFIVLDFMARYSFAVFFIHGYILTAIMNYKEANGIDVQFGIIGLLVITFVITMVSAIIAHTIKKIIPNKSRMIIGA